MRHQVAIPILISCLCGCASMVPQDDPWTGRDKFDHFWVSGVISSATTAIAKDQDIDDSDQFAVAMGVTLSFGVSKEAYDIRVQRGWSWKDIVWDIAGALTGFALVEAAD